MGCIAYEISYQFLSERCETQKVDNCVFPFWYDGKEYYNCTRAWAGMPINSKPWCATRGTRLYFVEKNPAYNDSDWGYCHEGCPTEGN